MRRANVSVTHQVRTQQSNARAAPDRSAPTQFAARRKACSTCCQLQKSSALNFHRFLPLRKPTALRDHAKGAMTDFGCCLRPTIR